VPNALENYKKYLSSGGSDYSIELLKKAGVNLETDEPYDVAFSEMKWALNELNSACSNPASGN
jgi:oligoendopeptidase F